MKIIISPAKQMKITEDFYGKTTKPIHLNKTKQLVKHLQSLSYEQLKKILNCSDKIAKNAYDTYQTMDLNHGGSPAIMTYSGIQYQYMAPGVFFDDEIAYLQDNLFILSGLYGILRPLDEIVSYRLEMQAKCPFSLYEFWGDTLAKTIHDDYVLNLASEEYAKTIRKYKKLVDVRFTQNVKGKLVEKGVYAKMARGEMVRYLAQTKATSFEDVKQFRYQNYQYSQEHSSKNQLTFIQSSNETRSS